MIEAVTADRAFAAALEMAPDVREAAYGFAGRPVLLRVAGADLGRRVHRAFAHLRQDAPAGGAPLVIDLWDEGETGIAGEFEADEPDPGRQWIACGGRLTASSDGRLLTFRYQDSISVLDRQAQRILGCRRRGSHLCPSESSKPLMLLLSVWYHDRGVQMLHAGLVARNGVGILIPGQSGTGKSTASLASAVQGLEFLSDDFVGIERTAEGAFLGHSVFNTACIVRENLSRFPELRSHAVEDRAAEEEKPILFLSEIYPDRVRATVPIRALALLRIRNPSTEVRPATRPQALRGVAASTLHTVVPRPGREALETIGELVERVPAYWLALGPDLSDIAPGLDRILELAGGRFGS